MGDDHSSDRLAKAAGLAKQVKGSLREAIGKVTGNAEAVAKGAVEKAEGLAQSRAGQAKTARRDAPKQ